MEFQTHWMPAPTREQPYPLAQDRIWRRFRDERMLLEQLLGADLRMLQLAADIESSVEKMVVAE